jgi:hypothetical protein
MIFTLSLHLHFTSTLNTNTVHSAGINITKWYFLPDIGSSAPQTRLASQITSALSDTVGGVGTAVARVVNKASDAAGEVANGTGQVITAVAGVPLVLLNALLG